MEVTQGTCQSIPRAFIKYQRCTRPLGGVLREGRMLLTLGLGSTVGFQVCACMLQNVTGARKLYSERLGAQADTGPHD